MKIPDNIIPADWTLKEIAEAHNKLNQSYFDSNTFEQYEAFFKLYEAFEWIINNDKDNKTLLDIGCGAGWHAIYLQKKGLIPPLNYVGYDISKNMCDIAKKNFPEGEFNVVDICNHNIIKTYDIVMESAVIELTHNCKNAFSNMLKCSKKWFISHRLFIKDGKTYIEQVKTYNKIPDIRFHIGMDDLREILLEENFQIAKEDIWHDRTYKMGTFIFRRKDEY